MINHLDPDSKAEAAAFYLGATRNGGQWYDNTVTTNVKAIWVATLYGDASNAVFSRNKFKKVIEPGYREKPLVRVGWDRREGIEATNIQFRSNDVEGGSFDFQVNPGQHSYSVYWTLDVRTVDTAGRPLVGQQVSIRDSSGSKAISGTTDESGHLSIELLEYAVEPDGIKRMSPYTIKSGNVSQSVSLDRNSEVTLTIG